MIKMTDYQAVAMFNPFEHFCFFAGVAAGKTYTGSHFILKCLEEYPGHTALIGANTYDQLSQATLREFFYWLDFYQYDYLIDQRPPPSWGLRREFKTYKNVITIRPKSDPDQIFTILTRVMSEPNPLRGIEFTFYWLDESRDTPVNTHDVVISRMRENKTVRKGLVTTTTNGEDWAFERFVKNTRRGQKLYGSMHVKTYAAVEAGIISFDYYNGMKMTYSPLMAQQELDAMHVNIGGGRAYYSGNADNRKRIAPWGDAYPAQDRPLIIGCDFNFSPAPCVWMVGQIGPDVMVSEDPKDGYWSDHIHWFKEIVMSQASTPDMTLALANQYPNYFYRIFGDSSGQRGTTSNAGEHDYGQMGRVLNEMGASFTCDVNQSNPHVKDRVENMCRMLNNSVGQTRMTYNPDTCPLFDSDIKMVGWKVMQNQNGRGRLDNGGKKELTHATDGAGYAVWKLFPYISRVSIGLSVKSTNDEIRDQY